MSTVVDVLRDYQPTPYRAKKDRKRWCRGRAGVRHEWGEPRVVHEFYHHVSTMRRCTGCGRKDWGSYASERKDMP